MPPLVAARPPTFLPPAVCLQAALYGQLAAEVLARRAAKRYDEESLALAAKLLELNPEVRGLQSAWARAAVPSSVSAGRCI